MGQGELKQLKAMLQMVQDQISQLKSTTEKSYAYQYKKMNLNKNELESQIEEEV